MRLTFPCLLALLAAGCADDTAATGLTGPTEGAAASTTGPDESTGQPGLTTGPTTTGPGTATTSTSATTGPTTATTAGPGDTTDPGTTVTGSTTDATTSGETTSGPLECGAPGPAVQAELVHVDAPNPCGPLTFEGQNQSDAKGPAWMLDGCACGASCLIPDPWTFTMAAPNGWLPLLPACPKIVVERFEGFGGCEFAGVSIWDSQQPGAPAIYHAGHGFTPVQAAAGELAIEAVSLGTCACDGCCTPPELFTLKMTLLGDTLTVGEGEEAASGGYTIANFESHSTGICDAPLAAHWAIKGAP